MADAVTWQCSKPFNLTCTEHGHEMAIRCKRWRSCRGCALWKQWQLTTRFLAGIAAVPDGKLPMFFTLTFPAALAPSEEEAHARWRTLYRAMRDLDYLGEFGWVLQRQKNGTLHYHGIAHMPWSDDDLGLWRHLIAYSGFGPQQQLVVAKPTHARYCCRYISTRLAALASCKRAYSFTPGYPKPPERRDEMEEFLATLGIVPERCDWVPSWWLRV